MVIQLITYLRHVRRRGKKSEYTGTTYFNDVILYFVLWNWIFTQHDFAGYMGNGYCVSDCLYAYY